MNLHSSALSPIIGHDVTEIKTELRYCGSKGMGVQKKDEKSHQSPDTEDVLLLKIDIG